MNRICRWLADLLSRALEKNEREAVHGDLIEFGENGCEALRDVLSLIVRRQVAMWSDWRLWLSLVAVIFPVTLLLSVISREILRTASVYSWLYFHNWSARVMESRGFWYVLGQSMQAIFLRSLNVACLSWSAGFILGRYVRLGKPRLLDFLFCIMLLFGAVEAAPAYLGFFFREVHRVLPLPPIPPQQDPAAALILYRTILPLISLTIVVALPALWGMHEAQKGRDLQRSEKVVILVAAWASLLVAVLLVPGLVFFLRLSAGLSPDGWFWPSSLQFFFMLLEGLIYWPLAYFLAMVVTRRGTVNISTAR